MDHAAVDENDDNIFVYTGGRVPRHLRAHITRAIVHQSISVVDEYAFYNCTRLRSLECHEGVDRIRKRAFMNCTGLRVAKLIGVKFIEMEAFELCTRMLDIEFGGDLRTIGRRAFSNCNSVRRLRLTSTSVVSIEELAFENCGRLVDVALPEGIDTVRGQAFSGCINLRRITIPLKTDMFSPDCVRYSYMRSVFDWCKRLSTVELVGRIHQSVSYLSLDSWKIGMSEEFDRIKDILHSLPAELKTTAIKQWMESVLRRLEHYKHEHHLLLKEAAALLELALWKANLDEDDTLELGANVSNLSLDNPSARKKRRITSGAGVVIKGVLPFLRFTKDST
jgi:hypothetical protein